MLCGPPAVAAVLGCAGWERLWGRKMKVPPYRFARAGLGLLAGLLLTLALQAGLASGAPATAATLGQVLARLHGNPGHATRGPCLATRVPEGVPATLPADRCAARTVGGLYLGLLRDRERLIVLRAAITRQRHLLSLVQSRISDGTAPAADFLLADVELGRWQVEEARLIQNLLHAELFFQSLAETEPSQMVRPRFRPPAWPADEETSLALLAQEEDPAAEELPVLRNLLQHAWIDYRAAEREIELLMPMGAAAEDVAKEALARYETGGISLAELQARLREATLGRLALLTAEYQRLVVQFRILELLGRLPAVE
ncbi:MAG: hypothetical protein Tsb0032_15250 [Kiloniellaceae bacterium]